MFANCLLVNDFEKSLSFYRDILGLEINVVEDKFANFKIDNMELAIMEKSLATAMFPNKFITGNGGVLLCFQTTDVAKTCRELESKGVIIIEQTKTTEWGQTVAYFLDPDSNVWEISQS